MVDLEQDNKQNENTLDGSSNKWERDREGEILLLTMAY